MKDEVSSFNTSTFVLTPLPVVNAHAIITKSDKKIISITSDRPIDWKNKKN